MRTWWSLEVIDGATSAGLWADIHGDVMVELALYNGASEWAWHRHTWGVVLEVAFADEAAWERFLASPAVRAALDAVPDPFSGLIVSRGRGGSAGSLEPRRGRPLIGSGAAGLALPLPTLEADVLGWSLPAPRRLLTV